jgi:hypothetical protein
MADSHIPAQVNDSCCALIEKEKGSLPKDFSELMSKF